MEDKDPSDKSAEVDLAAAAQRFGSLPFEIQEAIATYPRREQLKNEETARRLGISLQHLMTLIRNGHIAKEKGQRLRWPEVAEQYAQYLRNRHRQAPTTLQKKIAPITPAATAPALNKVLTEEEVAVDGKDIQDLSIPDRIIKELQAGIHGAAGSAYQYARAMNEMIKAQKEQIKLAELSGKTITRSEVEHYIFSVSRQNRNNWLNWPDSVAVEMAETLGVDRRVLYNLLMDQVRKHLERIATLPVSLDASSVGVVSEGAEASSENESG